VFVSDEKLVEEDNEQLAEAEAEAEAEDEADGDLLCDREGKPIVTEVPDRGDLTENEKDEAIADAGGVEGDDGSKA
jgi:hypothetical protein